MRDIPHCCAAIASALNLQVEGIQGTPVRKSVQTSWLVIERAEEELFHGGSRK